MSRQASGTIALVTLGCKVNQADSASMSAALAAAGWHVVPIGAGGEPPEVIVVNSCTVTARAAAKSRQAARSYAARFPDSRVVLAGCYPQVAPGEATAIPGLAAVAGTGRLDTLRMLATFARPGPVAAGCREGCPEGVVRGAGPGGGAAVAAAGPGSCRVAGLAPVTDFERLPAAPIDNRVRAYLKVQDGCESACAYCVVPQARGRQRSQPLAECLAEARRLLAAGARELVLTGIRLGAYGRDLADGSSLAALIEQCASLDGLLRLRLSSLEPVDLTADLLAAMTRSPRTCRHLHLPLQSGSDRMLRLMQRGYDTAAFARLVAEARSLVPGLVISTDVMVGFPGETEEEYYETVGFVQRTGFMRLHVFPYSARPGTKAALLAGQLPRNVKQERARALIATGAGLALEHHRQLVGTRQSVLLETEACSRGGTAYEGRGLTAGYVRATIELPGPAEGGSLVQARIVSAREDSVDGRAVQ